MIINLTNLGGGGGGSTVAWNQIVTGGTEIANININGVQQQVYAPEGDCNYQIVDALSAVTNPQEGTRAYVKEKYVTETCSGWTFDCTGSGATNEGFIARFYKNGSELTKLYKSGNNFHWGWTGDGQWHRNANYVYKSVGNSKIFTIVFPDVNEITMTLLDSGTTTATTSQEFTYLTAYAQNYIYKSDNTWVNEKSDFYIDNWQQSDWLAFYNLFEVLSTEEKYKVTLVDGNSKLCIKYLVDEDSSVPGKKKYWFQGSDIFDSSGGNVPNNRLKKFALKPNGELEGGSITAFGNFTYIDFDYSNSAHTANWPKGGPLWLERTWNSTEFSYYGGLKVNGSRVAVCPIKTSKYNSGGTQYNIISMDWQYLDNNIHAEYIFSSYNLTLLKWEETPIGSGECNYQIVDNLSAVTNPQEGTKAYVREQFVTETWSGWTFDANNSPYATSEQGFIAKFYKDGSEITQLYMAEGTFYWYWIEDGEWHRNANYAYKIVSNSKIFQIVFSDFSNVELILEDAGTTTAITSYTITYQGNPYNTYTYTPNNTWLVDNKVYDLNLMTEQDRNNFYTYFDSLSDEEKYQITLIDTYYRISLKYSYKDNTTYVFQGSDISDTTGVGKQDKARNAKYHLNTSGSSQHPASSDYGLVGYIDVDYVSTAHTITCNNMMGFVRSFGSYNDWDKSVVWRCNLMSGDTILAMSTTEFEKINNTDTIITKWEFSGNTITGKYQINYDGDIIFISWEETPINTIKLGNTTLSESQLQALIALIPS